MAERWTRERRRQHTRELLIDAAEEVFARKGFDAAALDDIADTAGYTRGAIYAHFGAKEELFLAVNQRSHERLLDGFSDVISSIAQTNELDMDAITRRRSELEKGPAAAALGYEFVLFLMRNPEARVRVAERRRATTEMLAEFITTRVDQLGGTLDVPALTLARLALATTDSLVLHSHIDGVDLYAPFLEMFVSSIKLGTLPVDE